MTPEDLWQDLLEKDDRTSPPEYPDMALITRDEFIAAIRAAKTAARREGEGAARETAAWVAEQCCANTDFAYELGTIIRALPPLEPAK